MVRECTEWTRTQSVSRLSYRPQRSDVVVTVNSLLTRLLFRFGLFFRWSSRLRVSGCDRTGSRLRTRRGLRPGCCRLPRRRLRMRCCGRMRSRLRASCGRLTGLCSSRTSFRLRLSGLTGSRLVLSGLALGCLIRSRLILARARFSCLVFSCLVLGGFVLSGLVLGCFIRSRLIFSRTCCSCLILSGLIRSRFIFCRACCSRLVFGRFVFSGLALGCLIRSRLIFSRTRCRCLVFSRPVFSGLALGCLVRGRFIRGRTRCRCLVFSRPVFSGLALGCLVRGRFIRGRARCSCLVFSGLVFSDLVFGCLIRSRLILGRACCRLGSCGLLGSLARSSFVGCSCFFGRYHALSTKLTSLGSGGDCRPSVVDGRQKRMVSTGRTRVLRLHCGGRGVLRAGRRFFCRGWVRGNSTAAAVIAYVVYPRLVDYGLAVNVVNVRDVQVVHRAVVVEGSVIPVSATIAHTAVAEAVVDAAVEADFRTPIAAIPGKSVVAPTPIAGSPEQASFRRFNPGARNPEVAFIAIRPVARRPQIAGRGNHGLLIHRQRGRSDCDRHADLREQTGRYGHDQNCQQQKAGGAHFESPCQIILRLPG